MWMNSIGREGENAIENLSESWFKISTLITTNQDSNVKIDTDDNVVLDGTLEGKYYNR